MSAVGIFESGAAEWTDPDDAPEINEEWLDAARWEIGGQLVEPPRRRGTVEIRLDIDADVAAVFRTSEPGWETRVNEVLRKAVRQA